ncbi:RdgB/HAM1 family non-canonical purine NTP pyrophosphatase [Aquisalinus flavus]|uniref:dITP/XTP pyrophosphatase n=1 Tax=Aquisalinus flavus TaxID=1526572 RepID=A0A8J2V2W0_9PROT|nr:RdgB/HAM1 family non-canonical purine NTP pyrophosphatase [Aquisalinus flavus]MBD0425537.1 RdgB/HAM1 family non-canonical purine NTP pyrophosphatase [Aquisalinus flavus]UNE48835.1 RdgB/HAM1 family non-canonical purine NTP pyrophosphatase [Aquisalinus flavus]GGD15268.1 non-canonical purine NTP pyrophosphatase [Aquisalinus flavus]
MARKFSDEKLVLASHNQGKLAEFAHLFRPHGIEILSAGELGLPEPEETGATFEDNAILKALAAAKAANMPALADDSGLAAAALNGAPGVHSARWAGPERDFTAAMQRLEDELIAAGNHDRSAAFVCVLALAWPDGHVETVRGEAKGRLVWPPRGEGGFGYDPVFMPVGRTKTFAEMKPEDKKEISHRAEAFERLVKTCIASA